MAPRRASCSSAPALFNIRLLVLCFATVGLLHASSSHSLLYVVLLGAERPYCIVKVLARDQAGFWYKCLCATLSYQSMRIQL